MEHFLGCFRNRNGLTVQGLSGNTITGPQWAVPEVGGPVGPHPSARAGLYGNPIKGSRRGGECVPDPPSKTGGGVGVPPPRPGKYFWGVMKKLLFLRCEAPRIFLPTLENKLWGKNRRIKFDCRPHDFGLNSTKFNHPGTFFIFKAKCQRNFFGSNFIQIYRTVCFWYFLCAVMRVFYCAAV